MSESYTKLMSSIVQSTVWSESLATKVVWITMLALSDRKGYVGSSVPGLAKTAGVTIEQCEDALLRLHSPDPHSRTKTHEGRRLATVDRGWHILNYEEHRNRMDDESVRSAKRLWWATNRGKGAKKAVAALEQELDTTSETRSNSTQAAPAVDAVKETKVAALPLPDWLSVDNWNAWVKIRPSRARTPDALRAALRKLDKFRQAGHDPNEIVESSLANGHQGLFEPKVQRGGAVVAGPSLEVKCVNCKQATKGYTNAPMGKLCSKCWSKYMDGGIK